MSVFRQTPEWHEQYKAKRARECAAVDLRGDSSAAEQVPSKHPVAGSSPVPRSKYGNTKDDGYDSKREAKRAFTLRLMQEAGEITDLRHKVKYILIPAQYVDGKCVERACTYTADFVYKLALSGKTVVEDAKGYPNDRWAIKRKLMLMIHGVRVEEV